MRKSSINGPFPMAMLNNQRIILLWMGSRRKGRDRGTVGWFLGHFSDREPWSYQSFAILELNPIIAYYIYIHMYIHIYIWVELSWNIWRKKQLLRIPFARPFAQNMAPESSSCVGTMDFFDFPFSWSVIIPTDFHSMIFQSRLKPPTSEYTLW